MARILIIDDSPTDAAVLRGALEKNGHEIELATSAEDGIEAAKAQLPDLVLMDVILPGMNGFQATRALARDPRTQGIPVIIISTKDMETDRVWGMRQGARDYIVKTPSERDLLERIDAVLAQR